MWLRRLVGTFLILTCISMNVLVFVGLFSVDKVHEKAKSVAPKILPPVVKLTISPATITAGTTSALSWSTEGNPTECTGTSDAKNGNWDGQKTIFGAESTGRLSTPGTYTYTLSCKNASGTKSTTATISVGDAAATAAAATTVAATPDQPAAAVYCMSQTPCYGKSEVAAHSSPGDCWGWNGDRVIDVSSLNSQFHSTRSGISSIEVGGVCGTDLSASLSSGVTAEGQARNHNGATKNNLDTNLTLFFIGYFDASK